MNIKLFLEIAGEFFDQMYAGDIYYDNCDYLNNKNDVENGFIENKEKEEEFCYCNVCSVSRQILLFINPEIYKKLNDNKII